LGNIDLYMSGTVLRGCTAEAAAAANSSTQLNGDGSKNTVTGSISVTAAGAALDTTDPFPVASNGQARHFRHWQAQKVRSKDISFRLLMATGNCGITTTLPATFQCPYCNEMAAAVWQRSG
jgi:hypothetical protein